MNKLGSRLILLVVFAVTFLGIFWMIKNTQNPAPSTAITAEGFISQEKGKVIVVEFADFQCPACAYYYPLVKQLKSDYGDKITLTYKYFPLRQIHQNAQIAAQAGEAAKLQGKFNEMEDILFTKQNDWANLKDAEAKAKFVEYAQSIGLNKDQFSKDMDSDQAAEAVNKDYEQGITIGINSTPTFFIQGVQLNNTGNYDDFKSAIDQALAQ